MKKLLAYMLHYSMVLAEASPKILRVYRYGNTLLVKHWVNIYQKNGLPGWQKFWIPVFGEWGKVRGPLLAKKINIDTQCPRSLGSYHDFEDPIFGIAGHWEQGENGEPVRVETQCTACELLQAATDNKQCHSDFCRFMVKELEQNTGASLNELYEVEILDLLVEGKDTYRFVHRINNQIE
ncbi:hypothetical protein BIZ37_10500 [Photobacterium sp. BZF1]|uniref:hypothetical protein n=1 Tax=Photobacterium sp. BZF1 TaxID=1904457 RepID=UPI0016538AEA|nr:hypothetical protein [Photobacterium sp. BZF1]MBC7002988.1 hypothetical protein [Photobacterium sp. BZF1]